MTLPLWLRQHHQLVRRAAKLIKWPSKKYLGKPSKFALEILGVRLTPKQEEILAALTKPNARVAVRSGHGVGKTFLGAIAALYWFACFPEGRVILSAPVLRQVEDLIWRTIKILHSGSGVCYQCRVDGVRTKQCDHSTRLDGTPARLPESGLTVGLREVKGLVVVTADTATGYMGTDQLWIGDESAGLRDQWLEAAHAGCKGGGSILAIGNPTRNTGFHADAFRRVLREEEESFWTARFTISCFDTPNVVEGREVIKGLVTLQWVNACKLLWGERSALYAIRVLGVHPEHEKGMLVSFGEIELAHARWMARAKPDGDCLEIGIDVAAFDRAEKTRRGETVMTSTAGGVAGDKWVMVTAIGSHVCEIQKWGTMTRSELVLRVRDLISKWRTYPNIRVVVRYDTEGLNGSEAAEVLDTALALGEARGGISCELEGVKASMWMGKESRYGTVRDAMYAALAEWIRDEAEIPEDLELDDELVHHRWVEDPKGGREKILDKAEIKKQLNDRRSPDTAEALAICKWQGRVIGHTEREREAMPDYIEPWRDGLAVLPKHKRDPGVRGYRRGGM